MSESDSWGVEETPDERAARLRRRSLVLVGIVLAVGAIGIVFTIGSGRTDSAMLFVGMPTLLALAVVLSPPARSLHGMTFKGITLGLLLAAVLLHEGAICVLFAAPLVYAVGHIVAAVASVGRRNYAVVPLALLLGAEGLMPGWRVEPNQQVTATHTVAVAPTDVAARIAAGPRIAATPRPFLLAMMPMPEHVGGAGIDPGDRWLFHFHGDAHGPGGELVTEVAERTADSVRFRVVSDSSIAARWLDWREATLRWHTVDGGTEVSLEMTFTRGLDPSWYFGPVDHLLTQAAAGFLLDSLGLPDQS
jgi:hypothetical protein